MNQSYRLKNGEEITIKRLTASHLEEIQALQRKVIGALTITSFLQPLTTEEFLIILNGKGLLIGAYSNGQLIAFRAMLAPELDEEHLGRDAGLAINEWPLVLYSEITNVDPDFQGNGLQLLLGKVIMDEVDEKRYPYICATVAPFNIASLKDKFALGFQIVSLKMKYGDLLRYTMLKDFKRPIAHQHFRESQMVLMENTDEQQHYFDAKWIGTAIKKDEDQWFVQFQK
ncbi:GNAT family N-acetyltransferase [Filibacter tadaridae]|uniref:N-acetyltransferase domain-containing protein n=1 Tax=Filibacter tadaridae TaxID=2483811 RepID=A0A3P5X2F0_9BACL|nr:GNAT family N-acetyltransferase [Filibacter tadaridae]VDC28114.1 hypothetical protein FILTAD_01735 [Filibacter tadaridae]